METITRQNFWQSGTEFGRKSGWQAIATGTPQFQAWHQYFASHLGFVPWVLEECLERKRNEMTMPTNYPEHFDLNYSPNDLWTPPRRRGRGSERWMRQNLAEMQAHFGLNWGIVA